MSEQVRDYADKVFREALLKPANLRDLVHARVPELADGFDFEQMNFVPPKFLLPDGRDRESDLLFEIPYQFGDRQLIALVCVLIEHQTRPDPRMALRTLLYVVLCWERKWSEWEALSTPKPEFFLPPVLPIVFHTGTRPRGVRGSARSIAELLGEPSAFHPFAPIWAPLFWELPKHSVDELLSAEEAFLHALAVVRVEDAEQAEFERVFQAALQRIFAAQGTNRIRWADLVYFIIGWITHRRPLSEGPRLAQMAQELAQDAIQREEVKKMVETMADAWLAEGRLEGKLEGRAIQERKILVRLGSKRLGEIDSATEAA